MLSASDIETYRTCPLKYKFARVFRIPSEPTLNQRFGILVHQVLERYHAAESRAACRRCSNLLEAGWRRGGFGDSEEERQFRAKATQALVRYHDRFRDEDAEPVWFERSFQFRMGPHLLRGRVDRVDKLPDGGYELIDYKTGRPKSAAQLRDDVQLSLYAVGAREAWQLEAAQQAYYYVLDDAKVPVPRVRRGPRLDHRDRARGRRRHPRPGLRADAELRGVLDVRLPDRLPGGRALNGVHRLVDRRKRGDLAGDRPAACAVARHRRAARARRAPASTGVDTIPAPSSATRCRRSPGRRRTAGRRACGTPAASADQRRARAAVPDHRRGQRASPSACDTQRSTRTDGGSGPSSAGSRRSPIVTSTRTRQLGERLDRVAGRRPGSARTPAPRSRT